ncbi:MAG TPA: caspase family protein [Kofleriaceae bacterium]|nr:caspase family protein [Kofleriaceae bacterium]
MIKLSLIVLCALAAPAAAVTRYALVIGNDAGDRDELRLHYAEHDADRFAATLIDLGGFAPGDVVVLRGGDAERARAALITLNERIRLAGSTDTMLVVYYSGHADSDALHLGSSSFALTQLEQLVRGSPAAFRLLVVDACRSGGLTRVKGGHEALPFPIALGDTLAADGVVFWTASAASEEAQESDAVRGSLFSHYLMSGLAGPADTDGDGQVTTAEAYEYARAATLRASSRTIAGPQHPTFRDELAGRDAVVLTRPGTVGGHRAQLRVPDHRDVLVLAGSADGAVIAEVGVHDTTRKLNVRAGNYFIRERADGHLLEGTVVVAAGDDHLIDEAALSRVDYVRVAAKGAILEAPRHDSIEAGVMLRTPIVDGGDACTGAIAGYSFDLGWIAVTPRFSACRERARNAFLTTTTDDLVADVRASHAWHLGPLSIAPQVQVGGAMLHQSFDTTGIAPARSTAAALFGAGGVVGVALGSRAAVTLATELDSFVLRHGDGMSPGWQPVLTLSTVLGLGVSL